MELSKEREIEIKKLMPFVDFDEWPCDKALEVFFKRTSEGQSIFNLTEGLTFNEKKQVSDLLVAHEIVSHPNWSSLLEGLWLDGIGEGNLLIDCIRDCYFNVEEIIVNDKKTFTVNTTFNKSKWFTKLPVYERAYKYTMFKNRHTNSMMRQRTFKSKSFNVYALESINCPQFSRYVIVPLPYWETNTYGEFEEA